MYKTFLGQFALKARITIINIKIELKQANTVISLGTIHSRNDQLLCAKQHSTKIQGPAEVMPECGWQGNNMSVIIYKF